MSSYELSPEQEAALRSLGVEAVKDVRARVGDYSDTEYGEGNPDALRTAISYVDRIRTQISCVRDIPANTRESLGLDNRHMGRLDVLFIDAGTVKDSLEKTLKPPKSKTGRKDTSKK